jgi:hypothetical protein
MRLDFRAISCAVQHVRESNHTPSTRPLRGLWPAAALCSLLAIGPEIAARAQTAYAPGGLFVHPTAFTPKAHQYSIYTAAFTQDQALGVNHSYYPFSLSYSPSDRLQVSGLLAYHQAADDPSHTHLGTFLKYQILPDTRKSPAFAIAGAYVGHDHLESSIAGVFSHAFLRGTRIVATLHAGAKWGRTGEEDGNRDDVGGFIGAQLPVSRQWSLVGETSTRFKFDRSAASSIGVMYETPHGPDISIGLVNGGRSSRMKFFFGVGYPFGQ